MVSVALREYYLQLGEGVLGNGLLELEYVKRIERKLPIAPVEEA